MSRPALSLAESQRTSPTRIHVGRAKRFAGLEAKSRQVAGHHSAMTAGTEPSRHGIDASCKKQSRKPCKVNAKDVDWADVTDPEERRLIQNRIAQRKFREKAREMRERAERESRNLEHAGNSYRIPPDATDVGGFSHYEELSGLPWGGLNLSVVISRGHEAESRRSSGRGTCVGDEPPLTVASPQYAAMYQGYPHRHHQAAASYGSSEDILFDDAGYLYDATAVFPPSA